MPDNLPRIKAKPLTGDEPLLSGERELGHTLIDFWRWSASDLVSNATRGRLAEFIVAAALGIGKNNVRDEWGAFDLTTPDGIGVEVKSAAYVQSWNQEKYSKIVFGVQKTRAWSPDTNLQEKDARRQAQVYVFALLAHKDKASINPLNVDQWTFYILPTSVLNRRTRSQHSITLPSLEKLAGPGIPYGKLKDAVQRAAHQNSKDIAGK